ncbi:MAG: O-antigen ligase family protein, partial [Thermoleophilaceae bacterium]
MTPAPTLAPSRRTLDRLVAFGRANPVLIPALLAVAVFVALGASEAGFYPINSSAHRGLGWYPAGLLLMALLTIAVVSVRPRGVPRAVVLAGALLAGFVAWSFLSIAWAEAGSVAWDGANRGAIYLAVFCLFALWPATEGGARVLIGALGLGIAGIGVVELLSANASSQPMLYFVDARLTEPAGYVNANVALWTIGLWPCLYLATARAVLAPIRGLALGGAGVLACLAAMGQSRGWVLAIPVAALLFVALTSQRGRAIAAVGAVGVAVALVSPSLVAVHDDFTPRGLDGLLGTATSHILLMAVILAVAGTMVALADRRVLLEPSRSRTVDRGVIAAAAACVLVGLALLLARTGDPVHDVSASWQSFKKGGEGAVAGQSRFASVGTNRYDFWRVAWGVFGDRPLGGAGSANFQQDYLAEGHSEEQPRYPHSLELGVLSQTGIIGALLLGGAPCNAAVATTPRHRAGPEAAAVVAGAATVFGYWFIHG